VVFRRFGKPPPDAQAVLPEAHESLIETLEFIPEPDGSATDDFVIPKEFQERQQRR